LREVDHVVAEVDHCLRGAPAIALLDPLGHVLEVSVQAARIVAVEQAVAVAAGDERRCGDAEPTGDEGAWDDAHCAPRL
jgi:hypothetical protein